MTMDYQMVFPNAFRVDNDTTGITVTLVIQEKHWLGK